MFGLSIHLSIYGVCVSSVQLLSASLYAIVHFLLSVWPIFLCKTSPILSVWPVHTLKLRCILNLAWCKGDIRPIYRYCMPIPAYKTHNLDTNHTGLSGNCSVLVAARLKSTTTLTHSRPHFQHICRPLLKLIVELSVECWIFIVIIKFKNYKVCVLVKTLWVAVYERLACRLLNLLSTGSNIGGVTRSTRNNLE